MNHKYKEKTLFSKNFFFYVYYLKLHVYLYNSITTLDSKSFYIFYPQNYYVHFYTYVTKIYYTDNSKKTRKGSLSGFFFKCLYK